MFDYEIISKLPIEQNEENIKIIIEAMNKDRKKNGKELLSYLNYLNFLKVGRR